MCEAMRTLMHDEIMEAQREGEKEGELKKAKDMALSLSKMGVEIDKIAEAAKVSVQLVQEWLSGTMNAAK